MISTDALPCALCGAEAKTGYIEDDFCYNVKRAICSNADCVRSEPQMREYRPEGRPPIRGLIILTVVEWNAQQEGKP